MTSGDKYPSLVPADNDVAKNFTEGVGFMPVSEVGITPEMYANAYQYTVDYATVDGDLMAVTWQATPGCLIYRTDIAEEVLGTSDPAEVQEAVKDWDAFFAAADKLKEAGKFIVSGPDDIKYAVWDSQKQPWVTIADDGSEKLTLDDAVTNYLELAKRLYDGDYTKKTSAWGSDWYANMSGDVLGYFGTTWFMGQIEGNCGDTFGNWAACTGPSPYHWGGTYVMVGKDTPNPDLCGFIIYELCCDADSRLQQKESANRFLALPVLCQFGRAFAAVWPLSWNV
jgi:ABC-type glycerol-3-phosphate transport system substrate-binding protein